VPLVRCPTHGRVYDSDKERGCPLCLKGVPGANAPKAARTPEEAQSLGRTFLLLFLMVIVAISGGVYWYTSTHNAQTRAQAARDSLRALAAGPPEPDTTLFAAANDLTPIRRARALKAALERLLSRNRRTLFAFAAGPLDTAATDRATKRKVQQYQDFAKRWHDALDAATRNGTDFRYAPGVRYSMQMENVTNQLQAALSIMRDMVRRDEVRPLSNRRADATSVAGYLHAAGTVLTNLPR